MAISGCAKTLMMDGEPGWGNVPLAIDLGHHVDVVNRGINGDDLQGLPGHDSHHVGVIHAAMLRENHRVVRSRDGEVSGARLDVDKDIGHRAVVVDFAVLHEHRPCLFGSAHRIAGHIDRWKLWFVAPEVNSSDQLASRRA